MECEINGSVFEELLKMAVFLKITLTRCQFHCCCVFLRGCTPPRPPQNQLNQRNRTSSSNLAVNGFLIQQSNMKLLNLNLNCCQAFKCHRASLILEWMRGRRKTPNYCHDLHKAIFTAASPCTVRHLPHYKKSRGDTCPMQNGHKVQKLYILQFRSSWPCIHLQFSPFSLLHNCTHHDWLNVSKWDRKNISSLFMDFPSGIFFSAELHLSNGGTLTAVSTSLMRKLYPTSLVERWQDTSLYLCSWEMEPSDTNAGFI